MPLVIGLGVLVFNAPLIVLEAFALFIPNERAERAGIGGASS